MRGLVVLSILIGLVGGCDPDDAPPLDGSITHDASVPIDLSAAIDDLMKFSTVDFTFSDGWRRFTDLRHPHADLPNSACDPMMDDGQACAVEGAVCTAA